MAALPEQPHCHLGLARISSSALHRAVEVEDEVRHFGVFRILAVEQIENINCGLGGHAVDELVPF